MAVHRFSILVLYLLVIVVVRKPTSISGVLAWDDGGYGYGDDVDDDVLGSLFRQDYSPPAPPPPPPHPPSASCEDDLGGIGSLDTTCKVVSNLVLTRNVYVAGKGNFYVLPNVTVNCSVVPGCEIGINVTGNFTLGANARILVGSFELEAMNAGFGDGSLVNTTGLAGDPPEQTSGTPQGVDGAGGGHGGRGAACLVDDEKLPDDVWGGDAYAWSSLAKPLNYGSKGGTTSKDADYGGGGGGKIMVVVKGNIEMNGSLLAEGGAGGPRGEVVRVGSIYIKAYKMQESQDHLIADAIVTVLKRTFLALAVGVEEEFLTDVFSRHEDPKIFVHGGSSLGCPTNAGAAGTFYDTVPRSLIVDNLNMTTDTDTLLMEFPYQPLLTSIFIRNFAKAAVPLLWSRVQVQGQISLLDGAILSFGLAHYALSEFEVLAEELLMSNSVIKASNYFIQFIVYGALRMSVKMFLMWNSQVLIDGEGDRKWGLPFLRLAILLFSRYLEGNESSRIHSNANLGVHGQGLLNLSGPGNSIEAQRLVLSLFYGRPGSVLRGPLENATTDAVTPKLNCDSRECPEELLHPPEDCNVNASLAFTLQICRVEDILIEGLIEGSVVHFHRARTVAVRSTGTISSSRMGCTGGVGRGKLLSNGIGSGGGYGGTGGYGCYNGTCIKGGVPYGDADLPCGLGSGGGNDSIAGSTAGGGILVIGSLEHPLTTLSVDGSLTANGGSFGEKIFSGPYDVYGLDGGSGGGSGGTILLFLNALLLGESGVLSSAGGYGSRNGSGGGGGGRIHFHWARIPTGDVYQPIASVKGNISIGGGLGGNDLGVGEDGTITGRACPRGLYGTFCEECPIGTYKNVTGSDRSLCFECPPMSFLIVLSIYLSEGVLLQHHALTNAFQTDIICHICCENEICGFDESPGPAPTQQGSQIDHSFPFLESLNEVLETNRVEESQSHVYRMYFMGLNTFSNPWHLPHTPPEQVRDIVYEGAFNRFVDEINALANYQWWEGSIYSILLFLAYPLAWSWQQWRRKINLQRLREFVRSEYDHACLRSCRSRALYEGIKVAATSDLMLAYVDFFLGGDEKRTDLPPQLHQRFPLSLLFGGDGSYMAPFSLQSDNIITSLINQAVPPTTWYRFVAGLNAQLRLVSRGRLRAMFRSVVIWLDTFANPTLKIHGIRVDLAFFEATTGDYNQYGLLVSAVDDEPQLISFENTDQVDQPTSDNDGLENGPAFDSTEFTSLIQHRRAEKNIGRKRSYGRILDLNSLQAFKEKRDIFFPLSFIIHNTKPVGHQDLVGLVISMLLLGDFSLVLLTLLQLYSISFVGVFLVLFILPLGILLPFPAGINALFSQGPRRSAGLARMYALWNITSFVNVVVAFICGYVHYRSQPRRKGVVDFPGCLVLCKCVQSWLVNWHVANLEIQDRSLYSNDVVAFWRS
ncbi:hypothetical protein OSB04_030050 [Centaurea solstitialis]|uniref:DUF8003 domain-containing protein n=1 Tax=Centaurea solstitialis TaxID=347529 RepID=A0AA38VWB8_9ASTR|nr:hypothetical protein OSB04_030050 [Centaurea solstitialis]